MPRKPRLQAEKTTYHVNARGVAEIQLFADAPSKHLFLGLLGEIAKKYRWRVHTYCLVATRYHFVVTTVDANISAGMRDLNGRYARWYNRHFGRNGTVFARRFEDDVIETDSHLLECVRDIALNPVRVGMSPTPHQYAWSSYAAMIGCRAPPPFLRHRAVLTVLGRDRRRAIARLRAFVETAAWPAARGLTVTA